MDRKSPRSSIARCCLCRGPATPHLDQPPEGIAGLRRSTRRTMSCSLQLTASRWGSSLLSHSIFFDFPTIAAFESYKLDSGTSPIFAYSYRNYRRVSDVFWCAVHHRTPRKCLVSTQFFANVRVVDQKSHLYNCIRCSPRKYLFFHPYKEQTEQVYCSLH